MVKVLQISSELNVGSIGKISEHISNLVILEGWESYIAYGREARESKSNNFRIGQKKDILIHALSTRIFDNHGFCSTSATEKLIQRIDKIDPDIIHLHHLHGYFINIRILFNYLKAKKKPIVWTFHDCWSFTGHCTHFEYVECNKWKEHCNKCPQKKQYPSSLLLDRSMKNFTEKRNLFSDIDNLKIVSVSKWLAEQVKYSFLQNYDVRVINNGIDLDIFQPRNADHIREKYGISAKYVILGVAGNWEARKGLDDFIKLRSRLSGDFDIVLVGVNSNLMEKIGDKIIAIERTTDAYELSSLYSLANVFVNPTLEDSFPTTNLEALACGTPVITYRTGGSVEAVDYLTGFVVEKNNVDDLVTKIKDVVASKQNYAENCRNRALQHYDHNKNFTQYIELYKELLSRNYDSQILK